MYKINKSLKKGKNKEEQEVVNSRERGWFPVVTVGGGTEVQWLPKPVLRVQT